MREDEVNMYLMTNKEFLPEENLPYLRQRLLDMHPQQFANISLLQFKSPTTLVMISFFLGELGVDRFMLGQMGAGIGKLLTFGGCGIWWLIDLFTIGNLTKWYNWNQFQRWL